ncbi:MAG: tyrosine-type recombinase/integrase [Planctomycetes bacterium]|nr:tyrosine-type recombinase/integrase [Planctomycetota bacterium]
MKLQVALERFVAQMRADGRSEHTLGQYRRAIGLLARWLEREKRPCEVGSITHETIAAFLNSPDVRTCASGALKATVTVNATRTSMRVFFAYLHDAGYAPTNAARLVRRAICSPPAPKALGDAEVERLLQVVDAATGPTALRDRALIRLLLGSGIRIGSALALDVDDVDLERGELRLLQVKGDRVERVFLSDNAATALGRLLATLPANGPVFRGPRGERLLKRCAQRRITQRLDAAGVRDASPHSLRHTFATRLLRRTGDLFLVKTAMLHRSIASTAVYLTVDDRRWREAVASIEPRPRS